MPWTERPRHFSVILCDLCGEKDQPQRITGNNSLPVNSDAGYHQVVPDLTAFVLAGGKSTRMGADKAFLRVGEETLLARALKLVRTLTEDVRIVGDPKKFADFAPIVIEDVYRDRGPLGGIHAALSATASELNLMVAVDMPFLQPQFLLYLVAEARKSGALVTVPQAAGGLQPLCAVYRREFGSLAEESLRDGKNKIDPLFAQVRTSVIGEDELIRAGFSPDMFRNLNTPQDLGEAERVADLRVRHRGS
jgi:molybdenum cofactor guanylyltransferase